MVLSRIDQSPNIQRLVQNEIDVLRREIIKIVLYSNISLTKSEISSKCLVFRISNLAKCLADKVSMENCCTEIFEQILELFITA